MAQAPRSLPPNRIGVAVPPFVAVPHDSSALPAAANAAAVLRGLIRDDPSLHLVTRYDSAANLRALEAGQKEARSGHLVAARYLILGAAARSADGRLRLDLRLVFAETGQLLGRDSATALDQHSLGIAAADAGRTLLQTVHQREQRP